MNIKKKCQIPKKKFYPAPPSHHLPPPPPGGFFDIARGWWWKGMGGRGRVEFLFWNLTLFFDIHFKNTFNLNFLGFKVSNERFFHKNFKTGLTF